MPGFTSSTSVMPQKNPSSLPAGGLKVEPSTFTVAPWAFAEAM